MKKSHKKIKFKEGGNVIIFPRKKDAEKRDALLRKAMRVGTGLGIALLLAAVTYPFWRNVLVRAELFDLYPSSCLGNWGGVQNALGKADAMAGFNDQNSAVFLGGDADLYCGNFFKGDDPALLAKVLTKATLSFSWSVVAGAPPGGTSPPMIPIVQSSSETAASGTPPLAATSSPSDAASAASSSAADQSPVSSSGTAAAASSSVSSGSEIAATSSLNGQASPVPAASSDSIMLPPPAPVPPPPPPPPPPPSSLPNNQTSSTSWEHGFELFSILPHTAFAAVLGTTADTSTSASAGAQVVSSTMLTIPFDIIHAPSTSSLPIIQNPDDFLEVDYSVDGNTWLPLGTVNSNNWNGLTFSIPLQSWQDLERLEIRLHGRSIGIPVAVYLDAIRLEVEYGSAADQSARVAGVPGDVPQPEERNEKIYDYDAKQQCTISPFSQFLARGSAASYMVSLKPFDEKHSFATELGKLPPGITASLTPASSSPYVFSLQMNASSESLPGSYSLLLVYRESYDDKISRPTFCEYNLIVR